MTPPARPSVSPLPSWASRPGLVYRPVAFPVMLLDLWRWLRPPRQTARERIAEERLLERLAEEIEASRIEKR